MPRGIYKNPEERAKKIRETMKGKMPKNIGQLIEKGKKTRFRKGQKAYCHWTGKRLTERHKEKIKQALKGKQPKNIKEFIRGSKQTRFKKGDEGFWKGKRKPLHSEETKQKIREALQGEKSHLWKGGISFEPYPTTWKNDLKESIRKRDKHICQLCKKHQLEFKEKLSIHHKDYDKDNLNPNNLISLCRSCHIKTNHHRDYWIEYFRERRL